MRTRLSMKSLWAIGTATGSVPRRARCGEHECCRVRFDVGQPRYRSPRHRIVARGAKGMTPGQRRAANQASHRPVPDHRFSGIVGTARKKATRPGEMWRDEELIGAAATSGAQRHRGRDRPNTTQWLGRRSSRRRNSASKALRLVSSSARFGMTTTSSPEQSCYGEKRLESAF